jgi:hypothetical protein
LQPGDLLGLRVAPLTPAWGGQPRQRTDVAGLAPLHDVAGIRLFELKRAMPGQGFGVSLT